MFSLLEQVPGPGAYGVRDAFAKYKQGKGSTMGARPLEIEKSHVPGPGSYVRKS